MTLERYTTSTKFMLPCSLFQVHNVSVSTVISIDELERSIWQLHVQNDLLDIFSLSPLCHVCLHV